MRNAFSWLKISTLAVAGLVGFSSIRNHPVIAGKSERASSKIKAAPAAISPLAAQDQTGPALPPNDIYALGTRNFLYILERNSTGSGTFRRLGRVTNLRGNLIGIDTRPADKGRAAVYGLTDQGGLYLIPIANLVAGLISNTTPTFAGGSQSLLDFNPVVDAIRLIGGNNQNYAIVSSGGLLNTTAVQTSITYATGDVNANVIPSIIGGAYTNNFVGATSTIFYAFDNNLDTLTTVAAPLSATGSSNTGGGIFRTIGPMLSARGDRVNLAPETDLDIYTGADGKNTAVGISGGIVFTFNVDQFNPNTPPGTSQNVLIGRAFDASGANIDLNLIDIAVRTNP